jgi:hypothetical protein
MSLAVARDMGTRIPRKQAKRRSDTLRQNLGTPCPDKSRGRMPRGCSEPRSKEGRNV